MSIQEEPEFHDLMREALEMAALAAEMNEVPVGALVTIGGEVVGRGHNQPIGANDPSAHAEIMALRDAASRIGNYRLPEATLVVTLEPCTMCVGAILQSRVRQLVFGAPDPKSGACGSVIDVLADQRLNHHTQVIGGVMAEACAAMLKTFFRARR